MKELRGIKIKQKKIDSVINIRSIAERIVNCTDMDDVNADSSNYDIDNDVLLLKEKLEVDITDLVTFDDIRNKIRNDILSKYNAEINDIYIYMYYFICWYGSCRNKILKLLKANGCKKTRNIIAKIIDFDLTDISTVSYDDIKKRLSEEYDKENWKELIKHEQLRLYNNTYTKTSKRISLVRDVIEATSDNIIFLNIINELGEIDNSFMMEWEYYSVPKLFRETVEEYNNEKTRIDYYQLKSNEKNYYDKLCEGNYSFRDIIDIPIVKEGKERIVYRANNLFLDLVIRYLAKRMRSEFKISFPHRDNIMNICFDLIDSLPKLENYTIFKFDFEDFFNSVCINDVYKRYIEKSNLYSYEKKLIKRMIKYPEKCLQGLQTSNVFIEIISRDFDNQIKSFYRKSGLIFYRRYVDDCILIFNRKVARYELEKNIKKFTDQVYNKKVKLSQQKTIYQTKFDGDIKFDYLGYSFEKCAWYDKRKKEIEYYYYRFGIADKKIHKYKMQLDKILDDYKLTGDDTLLLRRLQYYNSRIVFYNYYGSKYVNKSIWDVRGIIHNYCLLQKYINYEEKNKKDLVDNKPGGTGKTKSKKPYRIEKETKMFLRRYLLSKIDSSMPFYLQGKGAYNHTLWNAFISNRSIVFQANVGWSNQYITERCIELGLSVTDKSYSEKTRLYCETILKKP